jgi:hypothetical protein
VSISRRFSFTPEEKGVITMYSRLELFDRQVEYTKMLRKAFSPNPSEETLVAWQIQDASDEIYRNYLLRE